MHGRVRVSEVNGSATFAPSCFCWPQLSLLLHAHTHKHTNTRRKIETWTQTPNVIMWMNLARRWKQKQLSSMELNEMIRWATSVSCSRIKWKATKVPDGKVENQRWSRAERERERKRELKLNEKKKMWRLLFLVCEHRNWISGTYQAGWHRNSRNNVN